jgi:hypothetical protein
VLARTRAALAQSSLSDPLRLRAPRVFTASPGGLDPGRTAFATTGGAVAICPYTTIVGYGPLLLS